MAIEIRCFLDDDKMPVPINIRDLELSITRDPQLHGMQFEASTISLQFTEEAFDYIQQVYNSDGLKASINCIIDQRCDPYGEWENVINGKLNIGQRSKKCGNICSVSVPIETSECEVLLNNKMDQTVNVDSKIGQDGITVLEDYFNLGIDMEIPTKALDYRTEGYVDDAGDVEPSDFSDTGSSAFLLIRPDFKNEKAANISDSNLTGASTLGFAGSDGIFIPITPEVLYNESNDKCFSESFKVNGRLKGRISLPTATQVYVNFLLKRGEIKSNFILDTDADVRHQYADGTVPGIDHPTDLEFDWTFAEYDWTPINSGSDGLYLMLAILVHGDATGTITFDKESYFKVQTLKTCPPTSAKAYLVHEALSRIVESITNGCVRVKSEYYGRVESEPFQFPTDGCGGLRFFTSGLKLRNAPNATFFISPQDAIDGLRKIDNIGMGVEEDPDKPGGLLLRVEDLDFFYRDVEIMRCPSIPDLTETMDATKSFSTVDVGYQKWQTQANFGNDEFNSTRQYRTSLTAITNKLDLLSKLITGEYPIELTREQQYVDTSEADTTYDDEVFLICLRRITAMGYPYGEMIVEQGNVTDPENIFSPSSILNYGLSPIRNLMRWFRSIAAAYPNINDSDNGLFFNSGTGNFLAKGELSQFYGGTCRLELQELAENQNISPYIFIDPKKATPLWRNDTVQYDYPMSLSDYNNLKKNPYGYISYQCSNGEWLKGWVSEITYKPFDGKGTFKLLNKWR